MKLHTYSLTLSALALVLAAPAIASAKTAPTKAPVHAAIVKPTVKSIDSTTSGKIDTLANGKGTYTTTVIGTAKAHVAVTTEKFANGTTETWDVSTITAKNGEIFVNRTVDVNGKTTTMKEVYIPTSTAGDYTVKGTEVQANGQVDKITGTQDKTSSGWQADLTLKSGSKTETLDQEVLRSGNATASVTTGTNFNGKAIDNASLVVTNTPPATGDVTTAADGKGSYTTTTSTAAGQTDTTTDRTFTDGASSASNVTKTADSNGDTTYDISNSYDSSKGVTSSSETVENVSTTGAISGTFNQSNGQDGTLKGTKTTENYGSTTDLTYTNQSGQTRTSDTQTLAVGNAVLSVNDSTNFAGKSSDSLGLVAAK